ncbi:hypothetical protein ACIBQX_19140 [Nonomuraea sp. NPDC049714]|uniref:hypothetical protein n=1 Tax=Nonomuraea sp. NPDC049714 TaxID=3364357 RepID=UPI003797BD38
MEQSQRSAGGSATDQERCRYRLATEKAEQTCKYAYDGRQQQDDSGTDSQQWAR